MTLRIRQLVRGLGRPHPLTYLAIYLVAIPLFALLYVGMETEFYQSTATLDPSIRRQERALQSQLTPLFREWLQQYSAGDDRWGIDASDVTILHVRSQADVVTVQVGATFVKPQRESGGKISLVSFLSWSWHFQCRESGPIGDGLYMMPFRASNVPNRLALLLPRSSDARKQQWSKSIAGVASPNNDGDASLKGLMFLDTRTTQLLLRYNTAAQGLTVAADGSYSRFLYFSVVTITTLGFGDIVPVTDRARLWVATEAVFGIVVVGLFFNSLANRIQAQKSREPAG